MYNIYIYTYTYDNMCICILYVYMYIYIYVKICYYHVYPILYVVNKNASKSDLNWMNPPLATAFDSPISAQRYGA